MSRRGAGRRLDPELDGEDQEDAEEAENGTGDEYTAASDMDRDGHAERGDRRSGEAHGVSSESADATSQWDERYAKHDWPSDPDPLLVELAGNLQPGQALDLGCGTGRNAMWLATKGWQVTGVDASAVGLAAAADTAARKRAPLDLVKANLQSYRPQTGQYDLVVVANIHMLPDDSVRLFAMAATALRKGGYLFVVGHHLDDLGRHGPADPQRLYTVERLGKELPSHLLIQRLERVQRSAGGDITDPGVETDVVAWAQSPD